MTSAASRTSARGGIHVALLRGINVGGKHIVPMKTLAAMFGDAGCKDVRTYIQSGNVVYRADAALAARVPALVGKAIEHAFGFDVAIVTRTAAEMGDVVARNPFLKKGTDSRTLHVGFFLEQPSKASIASLDPGRSPPDRFAVLGREIYFYCPNGLGQTRFTSQYLDSTLKTTVTVRNWNTVMKLFDLTREGRES